MIADFSSSQMISWQTFWAEEKKRKEKRVWRQFLPFHSSVCCVTGPVLVNWLCGTISLFFSFSCFFFSFPRKIFPKKKTTKTRNKEKKKERKKKSHCGWHRRQVSAMANPSGKNHIRRMRAKGSSRTGRARGTNLFGYMEEARGKREEEEEEESGEGHEWEGNESKSQATPVERNGERARLL